MSRVLQKGVKTSKHHTRNGIRTWIDCKSNPRRRPKPEERGSVIGTLAQRGGIAEDRRIIGLYKRGEQRRPSVNNI